MKKVTIFTVLIATVILILSSCSGSEKSMLFGSLPAKYAELKEERAKLDEKAKNIKTEEEKAEIIKKGKKLEEKWIPKLERAATKLDGKDIPLAEGVFKVTSPISLTFEKLKNHSLEPIFKINGSAVTNEAIKIENTFSQYRIVYIAGYDAEGNEVYKSQVGKIYGEVTKNVLEIPAGTPVEFSTLTFNSSLVDKYPEAKTLKLICSN